MPEVTDAQIASYEAVCESLGRRVAASPRAQRVGADLDDLVQEGRLHVWQSLQKGITPSAEMITNRMTDYVRWLGTQIGLRRFEPCDDTDPEVNCEEINGPVPYEAMLPLDDISGATALDERLGSDYVDVEARLG